MTRLLSPALRSGLMVLAGAALIVVPFAVGLSAAAVVTGIAVGALAVALGLAGTAPEGRGTLPVSVQAVYDRALGLGLLLAAVAFGIVGEGPALAVFGGFGVAALAVAATTRYSAAPV